MGSGNGRISWNRAIIPVASIELIAALTIGGFLGESHGWGMVLWSALAALDVALAALIAAWMTRSLGRPG